MKWRFKFSETITMASNDEDSTKTDIDDTDNDLIFKSDYDRK